MKTEYEDLFSALIITPLRNVVGRPLRAVNYYILGGEFDPETPNECGGCQGVHLVFDGGEVEFDWYWEELFRGGTGGIHYHLGVSDHPIRREGVQAWTDDDVGGLNLVPAIDTRLWESLVDKPLERVEVLGERLDDTRCSPQAARLYFPSASIVIAIGMTEVGDQPIWVGDGDEVLVFSGKTWAALPDQGAKGIDTLIPCWEWPK